MNKLSFSSWYDGSYISRLCVSGLSFCVPLSICLCLSLDFGSTGVEGPQVKVEPTLRTTLIIEEGRRGENGYCNIHMSYWLDCQPLARAPCTYEVSQMTEDATLPLPLSPSPPFYISSSYIHKSLRLFLHSLCHLLPPLLLLPLLTSPSPSLCHLFSSPSYLQPSLGGERHARGPNSIIDQIKEMLLNSLTRQKEHRRTQDMMKGYNHTHTQSHTHLQMQIFTSYSVPRNFALHNKRAFLLLHNPSSLFLNLFRATDAVWN